MTSLKIGDVNVNFQIWNENSEKILVLLHGFTGSTKTWNTIVSLLPTTIKIVAVDLMGHGKTDQPEEVDKYSMEEQIEILNELFDELQLVKFFLLGYSMGGRVALSYANKYPERIHHLILESSSPGLKTAEERQKRIESDEKLADFIMEKGLENFIDYWENIPLFKTQKQLPQNEQEKIRKGRLSQNPLGLANSLRGMGTGKQASVWEHLNTFTFPVTILAGSLDEKYCNIGKEMADLMPNAKYVEIEQVGHTIHVENPTQFAKIVKNAILNEN